ncbi:gustatory receptor for sugar taste 64e-like [Atheta coriaria]|uniref:gustatory receptor for sugar taste 64e-like n=1 Tax=Dalotia coriaria TaxID=877792 RepID=UPI0031F3FADF
MHQNRTQYSLYRPVVVGSEPTMPTTCGAFSGIIILAQCFGLFPLVNVRSENIDNGENSLKFKRKSFRFVHSCIIIILIIFNLLFYTMQVAEIGLDFETTVIFLFFCFGPASTMLLMHLARKWPSIMQQWTQVDVKMESYGFPVNLKKHLYLTTIVVMSFFITYSLTNSPEMKNVTNIWIGLNEYLKKVGSHVFSHIPYNPGFGIAFKVVEITITFVWSYMDVFIMTIAIALAARFRQINERIKRILEDIQEKQKSTLEENDNVETKDTEQKQEQNGGLWMGIREDYNSLCQLTAVIDESIAYIILLSFANNLFLILVQLLHSIEPQEKTRVIDRLYFVYSFGFLILRTSAVAMTSSQIYVESTRPSWFLTTQLPEEYCDNEVERLLTQIHATGGCFLTGNGFFKIKSSLILSIAGAVVSYELIFIQFHFSGFTWCYSDLFIMIMSSALAVRFQQITTRLKKITEEQGSRWRLEGARKNHAEESNKLWKEIREDYNKLCVLCRTLDEAISYLVLMSYSTNLFFILIQLFNSLRNKNTREKIYFFFSFGFLISRTISVSLYAAWVNDESKKPLLILNSIPSHLYNLEIKRFVQQISFDSVALTGRHFFHVTRGLILSVAGAIVTYELVLIQFNENLLKEDSTILLDTNGYNIGAN